MIRLCNVDQETIKESNRRKILNLLYKKRELTKQEIAVQTLISIPTVTNNINQLLEEGIVEEAGMAGSTGGRKPVLVRFIPDSRYCFGVEFSTESIRVILTNLDSQICEDVSINDVDYKNIDNDMGKVINAVNTIMAGRGISKERILGIGFSLPGTVNEEKKILEAAPNLNLFDIDFKKYENDFPAPMYLENEANAAAYAELKLGIAKELRNLVYVSLAHGIGGGIVIQDNLYKGKNKRAGEFGHMTIVPNGKQCNCGRKGCWELYASDKALIKAYNESIDNGGTVKIKKLKDFFEAVEAGQEIALKVLDSYLDYLSLGIQNIILTLDPHYIIIGGRISTYEKYILEPLKEKVFIENNFYSKEDFKILISKLKDDSSSLGASLLPMEKVFFKESSLI